MFYDNFPKEIFTIRLNITNASVQFPNDGCCFIASEVLASDDITLEGGGGGVTAGIEAYISS